jgi:urease accessory protein
MIILTKIFASTVKINPNLNIYLTAEERQKSRQLININENNENNETLNLQLNFTRGISLNEGDILTNNNEDFYVKISAKKEKVITVTSNNQIHLLQAAYHLGNRHVAIEINQDYLRLLYDPVLAKMLIQLGLNIEENLTPFYPEIGAYHHH